MKVNSKEVYYYLTKLHSSDIFLALLIPYDKSQVIRVVTVLIYLDCYVFVRVAAWDTVEEREREREREIPELVYRVILYALNYPSNQKKK